MAEKKKNQVWGKRLSSGPADINVDFCSGRDVTALPMADELLIEFDIWTNLAHTKMLNRVGVLTDEEADQLRVALLGLFHEYQTGEFILDPMKEDVHINIEHHITFHQGVQAGKKIHTGRSRNDQVSTDMRLYIRHHVLLFLEQLIELIRRILSKASEEVRSIMPGYTHYQPAMITTAAHWLTSWSQALSRDVKRLLDDLSVLNLCPLGAAASFGTSWPIDREYSAELLGFDGVEENSLDCISSRGENESRIASSLSILMNHFSTISQDIILLSTPHYNMLKIDDQYVTGSSIMPQKRNPDFAEIIRGKASLSHGILVSLLGIQKGAMSGFNRDTQPTKYLIMDLFRECQDSPVILGNVIETMRFNRDVMAELCEQDFMNSADTADWLAQHYQLPFRDCYDVLSLAVKYSESTGKITLSALKKSLRENHISIEICQKDVDDINTPWLSLNRKRHTGAPSEESVTGMILSQTSRLEECGKQLNSVVERVERAKTACFSKGESRI